MRLRQFLFLGVTLLGVGLPLGTAFAQTTHEGDAGAFQILEARYGTASNNVDVTDRLRDYARSDQRFRVENKMFGSDPAPGRVKTLRIHAQGPGGAVRLFEFAEGAIVDGAQFTGWEQGEWGRGARNRGWGEPGPAQGDERRGGDSGEYRILHARYGLASSNIDVTDRLRELARQDRTFKIENSLFGNDPAPGRVKTLRIYARGPGGETRTFDYVEGRVVDGARFTGWGRGDWGQGNWNGGWGEASAGNAGQALYIVQATYGFGNQASDVTDRVRSMARDGRLDIGVDNDTMGSDPSPGRRKQLSIVYSYGGRGQQEKRAWEQDRIQLP